MSEKYWYLKNCDIFEQLTPEELRALESRSRIRKCPRNTPIYLPADHADGVLLMASGRAKICGCTPDGKQSILTFIEPGEMFGELALFQPGEREEYAEAIVASTVVLIPAEEMMRLLEQHASVALGITRLVGLRRRRIERRLKYLLFHSNRERLVHLLLELVEQYGRPSQTGIELGIKLSHHDLASIIGSTRETVTVILGQLRSEGFVVLGRRKIVLRNVDRLAESVADAVSPSNKPMSRQLPAGGGPLSAAPADNSPNTQKVFRS